MTVRLSTSLLAAGVATIAGLSVAAPTRAQATGAAADATLEEVVVTARKRSERLEDVPLSISYFDESVPARTSRASPRRSR